MQRLDSTTTVLTAALALMTAFALASETPFVGVRGRVAAPAPAAAVPAPADLRDHGWVALNAPGAAALPQTAERGH